MVQRTNTVRARRDNIAAFRAIYATNLAAEEGVVFPSARALMGAGLTANRLSPCAGSLTCINAQFPTATNLEEALPNSTLEFQHAYAATVPCARA